MSFTRRDVLRRLGYAACALTAWGLAPGCAGPPCRERRYRTFDLPNAAVRWGEEAVAGDPAANGLLPSTQPTGKPVPVIAPLVRAGNTLSILFNSLQIDLQGPSAPLSQTRTFRLRCPVYVQHRKGLIGFQTDLRYAVVTTAGARAHLDVVAAGAPPAAFAWPVDQPADVPAGFHRIFTPVAISKSWDPQDGFQTDLPYQISLMLRVERDDPLAGVILSVDSLDVKAVGGIRC